MICALHQIFGWSNWGLEWAGRVARMEARQQMPTGFWSENLNGKGDLVHTAARKSSRGTKMGFKEIECEAVDWI
jgi:hypothetical protein